MIAEKDLLEHVVSIAAVSGGGAGQAIDRRAPAVHRTGGIGHVITSFYEEYPGRAEIAA